MRKIEYVVSNERLITPSGLSLVGQVLGKSNLIKKANHMRTEKCSQPQIKNGDILLTMIGLLSLGKSDFENVNEFHRDEEFYKIVLGIAYGIPSESSLRNRLDGIGTTMNQKILDGNVDMFLSCGYEPSSLANGCVPVGSIIPAAIKPVSLAPTRISTAMKGNDMPVRHSTIKRRRIRTMIDNLILIAGHLTDHARKLRLALGHCNGLICTFLRVAESF